MVFPASAASQAQVQLIVTKLRCCLINEGIYFELYFTGEFRWEFRLICSAFICCRDPCPVGRAAEMP